jgi:Ser/Thr protein kinase RdoA (MazF antagonist)
MQTLTKDQIKAATDLFDLRGEYLDFTENTNGHINNTFVVRFKKPSGRIRPFLLQRLNTDIFTKPTEVMHNIVLTTEHLRKKIEAQGGDPDRETITVIPARDGKSYAYDAQGNFWRCYIYIDHSVTYEQATPEIFHESAVAFGTFQNLLSDFDASKLYEIIPDFHNTGKRYEHFLKTVDNDTMGRAKSVGGLIDFAKENSDIASVLTDALARNEIPLRVTHNDTKLTNVLFDDQTNKAVCVIDLDTVMPGLSATDFGDAIRFGASTAVEDEPDVSKIRLDLSLFKTYAKGFVKSTKGALTPKELALLPMGAMLMTYECGIRFLDDYIDGDHYFRINYADHNMVRARSQFALLKDMRLHEADMSKIIESVVSERSSFRLLIAASIQHLN